MELDRTLPREILTSSSSDTHSQQPPVIDEQRSADAVYAPPTVLEPQQTAAVPSTSTQEPTVILPEIAEDICTEDLSEILGTDPSLSIEFGDEINKDVAHRFEYVATTGLDKEGKNELLQKYLVPSNCKLIAAPQLNPEIKAAISELVVKRDKAIELRQKQISIAITNIGQMLTSQINKSQRDNQLLKQLMDTGRILCDAQHNESVARRNFALYSIKKDMKEQLSNTKIDKYLFGTDLPETLKTAKAVSKSSIDLKTEVPKKLVPPPTATTSKNLNWRAGPATRKQPAGPPPRQPAVPPRRQQRTSSSHRSSHRHKQTRRR